MHALVYLLFYALIPNFLVLVHQLNLEGNLLLVISFDFNILTALKRVIGRLSCRLSRLIVKVKLSSYSIPHYFSPQTVSYEKKICKIMFSINLLTKQLQHIVSSDVAI